MLVLCVSTVAVMVLMFMFTASWRLTVVTFVLVPCMLLISKVRQITPALQGRFWQLARCLCLVFCLYQHATVVG